MSSAAAKSGVPTSRLFSYGTLEPKDDVEERFEKCHSELSSLTNHLRENEVYIHLNEKVSRSAQDHEEITLALLYAILTDPPSASKSYHTLTLVSRDSLALVTTHTERIVMEKMGKLQEHTRNQLLWLIRAMVETGVSGADKLCFALLKQLPAGTTSTSTVLMAENLMHMMLDNREWLEAQPGLISSVVYTYLSIIPCYVGQTFSNLREQTAHMCVNFIRTRFDDCVLIGRDLLRLLQIVARIPEVTELWKDMIFNPQKLSPQFTSFQLLLGRRTSRRFIAGRILVDVEIKLNFLLSKVKFGQHKKYQEWFQKKYLSSPEALHQIPELIRFVCCVIHPTNEILASDVIPRWAVVGWLLSLAQPNPVLFGYAKLSLFYDWVGYNAESDNIMNIEPAILLMHNSLRSHPQLTASLLDFICRIATNYHPDHVEFVCEGIKNAFRDIIQKGVLLSLDPLFESIRLDNGLKALVRETFPDLCHVQEESMPAPITETTPTSSMGVSVQKEVGGVSVVDGDAPDNPLVIVASDEDLEGEDAEVTGAFSDSEEKGPDNATPTNIAGDSQGFVSLTPQFMSEGGRVSGESSIPDPWADIDKLPDNLKEKLLSLRGESEQQGQVDRFEEFLVVLQDACNQSPPPQDEGEGSEEVLSSVVPPLVDFLSREISESDRFDEGDQETVCSCLFRHMSSVPPSAPITPSLAVRIHAHQSRVSYLFLTYIYSKSKPSLSSYKDFLSKIDKNGVKSLLLTDLKECVESDPSLFYQLLPVMYKKFSKDLAGNHELLNLIVANIDPNQLHGLMYRLSMKEFQIFGKQSSTVKEIIDVSIHWDSFEQFCVWQLLCAESPDPHLVIPALAGLNSEDHPEALSSALVFLRTESSSYTAVGELLSLPDRLSSLVDAVAMRWFSGRPTKYGKLISQFLDNLGKKSGESDSQSQVLNVPFTHLQRLLSLISSKQVLEATDHLLANNLSSLFKQHPDLSSTFPDLHQMVTIALQASNKSDSLSRNPPSTGEASQSSKRSKHGGEPKAKKRKMSGNKDV